MDENDFSERDFTREIDTVEQIAISYDDIEGNKCYLIICKYV